MFVNDMYIYLAASSSWVEGGCPGCAGASIVISQPLDSKTLSWLEIPATQPWAPTQAHPGSRHTVITVKREKQKKKGGIVGGKTKNKKSTTAENNHLKKKQRPHNAFPNEVPNGHYTETAWPTVCDPMHVCLRLLTAKQTAPSWPRWTWKPASLCF